MKKVFLFAIALFACQFIQAQDASFGIKIGLGTSNFDVTAAQDVDGEGGSKWSVDAGETKVGFHAGFMGRISWDKFIIQPELYFSSVTNEFSLKQTAGTSVGTTQIADQTLSKLDIPVLIGFKPTRFLRVNAGPVASVLLSETNGIAGVLLPSASGSADDDTSVFTFGAQVGGGFDLGKLAIDIRYELPLTDLGDGLTVAGTNYNFDSRTDQILVSVGILF